VLFMLAKSLREREFTRFTPWIQISANRLPTLRPSQPTWTVSPPVGCYRLHPPSPFRINQPESWHSVYRPRRLSQHCRIQWSVVTSSSCVVWSCAVRANAWLRCEDAEARCKSKANRNRFVECRAWSYRSRIVLLWYLRRIFVTRGRNRHCWKVGDETEQWRI